MIFKLTRAGAAWWATLGLALGCDTKDALIGNMKPHGGEPEAGGSLATAGADAGGVQGGQATGGVAGASATGNRGGAMASAGAIAITAGVSGTGGSATGGAGATTNAGGTSSGHGGTLTGGSSPGGSSSARGGTSAGGTTAGTSSGGTPNPSGSGGIPSGGSSSGIGGARSYPLCATNSVAVQTCFVDSNTQVVLDTLTAAVTVTAVGAPPSDFSIPCSGSSADKSTAIGLRASDGREWTYFVYLPDRPVDQIQVGDELDLSVQATRSMFFDQSVVLGHGSELVLFTTATWHETTFPKLDTYGISLAYGDPTCSSSVFLCVGTERPLLVTQGADTSRVDSGVTAQAGDLSVSVQTTFSGDLMDATCQQIDPPTAFRFGGFRPRQ